MMAKVCEVYNDHKQYGLFATTVSQLKICDFSGETFKNLEVLQFSMSATMTQMFSSEEILQTALRHYAC